MYPNRENWCQMSVARRWEPASNCCLLQIACQAGASKRVQKKIAIPGSHTANQTCGWLQYYGWKFMDYCLYSLNFRLSDLDLWRRVWLTSYFVEETELKKGVTSWVLELGTDFCCARICGGLVCSVCRLCVIYTFVRGDPKIPGIVKKTYLKYLYKF